MVTTIVLYILIGILGVFGLALIAASIASIVHNLKRKSRVKKYINEEQQKQSEQQYTKTTSKYHNQEQKQHIAHDGRPIVVTQSGYDDQRVNIGYIPYTSTLHVNQTVQANVGNSADKPKKQVQNRNQVLSKYSRNNGHESKQDKIVPKNKLKNYNKYAKYNYPKYNKYYKFSRTK